MNEKGTRQFRCLACGHEWEKPFGTGRQIVCPQCGDMRIMRTNPGVMPPCGRCKRGRRMGWRKSED